MRYPLIFREADTDADPQGGASSDLQGSDVLDRYGRDALKLAEKLAAAERDNYTLRDKNRALRSEVTDLKSKAPTEGARVLTKEEAQAWEAYTALGIAPAAIQAAIAERDDAKGQLAQRARLDTLGVAAQAHGYKAAALAKLPSLKDQEITLKDVDSKGPDGKPVKVKHAYVGSVSLPDFIQEHDAEFLPALTDVAKPAGDGVGSPANGQRPRLSDQPVRSPGVTI